MAEYLQGNTGFSYGEYQAADPNDYAEERAAAYGQDPKSPYTAEDVSYDAQSAAEETN